MDLQTPGPIAPSLRQRFRAGIVRSARAVATALMVVAAVVMQPVGFREVLLFVGCGLLSYGGGLIYPPATYLVPGAILVGVAVFGVRA